MAKIIGVGLSIFAVAFLLAAFIEWDLNPNNWGTADRFLFAFLALIVSIGASALYSININPPKN